MGLVSVLARVVDDEEIGPVLELVELVMPDLPKHVAEVEPLEAAVADPVYVSVRIVDLDVRGAGDELGEDAGVVDEHVVLGHLLWCEVLHLGARGKAKLVEPLELGVGAGVVGEEGVSGGMYVLEQFSQYW